MLARLAGVGAFERNFDMSGSHSSLIRHFAGFFLGALIASVTSALVFLALIPLPKTPDPRNHTGEALIILIPVVFVCGGFIGRRALTWKS